MSTKLIRSFIEGPRWAGTENYLRNACWVLGLEIKTEVSKGLIRETVRFEVKGDDNAVDRFVDNLNKTITDWNKNTP
jgi:hypothetical protein